MALDVCAGTLKPSAQMAAKTEQASEKMRAKITSFYLRRERQIWGINNRKGYEM